MGAEEGNEESKSDNDVVPPHQTKGEVGEDGGGKVRMTAALSSFLLVALGVALLRLVIQDQMTVTRTAVTAMGVLWLASLGIGGMVQALGIPALLGEKSTRGWAEYGQARV